MVTIQVIFLFILILGAFVMTTINLFKIYKQMKGYRLSERLPWILYLAACCFLVLYLLFATLGLFYMNIVYGIFYAVIAALIPLSIIAGFLTEAFKSSWKETKVPWWIFTVIIVFCVIYAHITYKLDHNHIYGDDLDTMLMLAGVLVVPFFASMFAAFKAPDKNNRTIYGLIAFGYFCLVLVAIITIWTRFFLIEMLSTLFILAFFFYTWFGTWLKLQELKKVAQDKQPIAL